MNKEIEQMQKEIIQYKKREVDYIEALWKYGRHLPQCAKQCGYYADGTLAGHNEQPCTCGLERNGKRTSIRIFN
jgi:hypothetical protein